MPGVPNKTQELRGFQDEIWIKDAGQWWYYQAS
jgi:hypothetical protein